MSSSPDPTTTTYHTKGARMMIIMDRQNVANTFQFSWSMVPAKDFCCSDLSISSGDPDFDSAVHGTYDLDNYIWTFTSGSHEFQLLSYESSTYDLRYYGQTSVSSYPFGFKNKATSVVDERMGPHVFCPQWASKFQADSGGVETDLTVTCVSCKYLTVYTYKKVCLQINVFLSLHARSVDCFGCNPQLHGRRYESKRHHRPLFMHF